MRNVAVAIAPMRLIAACFRSTAGPLALMSVCGITSVFLIVSVAPRAKLIVWVGLNGPPFSDQEWHPWVWWRISRVAPFAEEADAIEAAMRAVRRRNERLASLRVM